jgi:spermidine synthase
VKEAVMVDIDPKVIECSKKYLPELSSGAFEDERADVVIGDGRRFVEGCRARFDVVVMDVTDPLEGGPAQLLYTKEFYNGVCKILSRDGIVVTQATSVYYSAHCFATIYKTMESAVGKAGGYQAWIPAYDSMWGFVYGTKGPDPKMLKEADVDKKLAERGIEDLRFYEGTVHRTLFMLSKELRGVMKSVQIATDSSPTFMPI